MPDPGPRPTAASVVIASACAFAIIATQVAGKATRDALFLTNFDISALPLVLMASALLSIGTVLVTARSLSLFGPLRIIPPLFLVSGLLLVAEWLLAMRDTRLASVIVYLHIAVIGSILISGFWSVINEHFDPRSARRGIARIVGGATMGGLFGGFLADRVGAIAGIAWVLPIVAGFHLACAFLLPRLTSSQGPGDPVSLQALFAAGARQRGEESGFRVLQRSPYVRNLALIVLLGNAAATLIDFLFKAKAAQSYPGGADLVRFFAVFYTAVSLVTLAVQMGMTRQLLERIGIANTMAIRPALVTVGGVLALPWLGLAGLGLLRGIEAVVQSSLFRSGYELLFSPVVPDEKRKTRTIVDVGADRAGDIVGGGIVRAVILLPAAVAGPLLMLIAVVTSIAGFVVARALRRGYVRALERSLIDRAGRLDIRDDGKPGVRTMMESFAGIDLSMSMDGISLEELRNTLAASRAGETAAGVEAAAPAPRPAPVSDPEIAFLLELRSGDANRVRAALRRARALSPAVASQVVSLLAWDEVTGFASRALAKAAPAITGQLVDRLLDPNEDFAVRRRIPRILGTCATPRAFEGLMAALSDRRFEVRLQTGLALSSIHARIPVHAVNKDAVYSTVLNETRVGKALWKDHQILDAPEPAEGSGGVIEEALRLRASRSMQHVFTLLSLALPAEPLQIAFKGLITDDAVLRGTSLEYLESVLPREVWDGLRPFLEDTRDEARRAPARPREEILEDLMRSSPSIELKLAGVRKHPG